MGLLRLLTAALATKGRSLWCTEVRCKRGEADKAGQGPMICTWRR